MSSTPRAATSPVRSMTGFASVRRQTSAGELTISLRSVNHRGLDLHFHHASELAPFENAMRIVLKETIGRGHVEIRAFWSREESGARTSYNRDAVARYVQAFRQAAEEHQLSGSPDLNVVLSMNSVLNGEVETRTIDSSIEATVIDALKECAGALNQHREREGRELLADFELQISNIEQNIAHIVQIRERAIPQLQNRLRERLRELLAGSAIPESRLIEEVALLTDRSDIQEELTRSSVHVAELRRILEAGGEVGKRIDFLLQEMNRETNTILSKTSGIGETGLTVSTLALSNKSHIDKIREQALNLE